ncbi:MAG: hypothetical protein DRR16_10615 [Candidatus Parabeggiatoa sp. nov. 3]|jgi:hypothetical protein|nr:MAG: hypothetical protein DRR00_08425 [Gammaproteobacteria bacterium]RKZ66714.1 MAG: hypothetical protein DRQ99_08740 [Gammaproteobacteria bacterium]RKZ86030.1 MAG: hypothetical protein DRR16_10615 [Gammaproteobacteria bacterium]
MKEANLIILWFWCLMRTALFFFNIRGSSFCAQKLEPRIEYTEQHRVTQSDLLAIKTNYLLNHSESKKNDY